MWHNEVGAVSRVSRPIGEVHAFHIDLRFQRMAGQELMALTTVIDYQ